MSDSSAGQPGPQAPQQYPSYRPITSDPPDDRILRRRRLLAYDAIPSVIYRTALAEAINHLAIDGLTAVEQELRKAVEAINARQRGEIPYDPRYGPLFAGVLDGAAEYMGHLLRFIQQRRELLNRHEHASRDLLVSCPACHELYELFAVIATVECPSCGTCSRPDFFAHTNLPHNLRG